MKHIFSTFFFLYFILIVPLATPGHAQAVEDCTADLSIGEIISNTHCASPNGALEATVTDADGNAYTGSLTYAWYPEGEVDNQDSQVGNEKRADGLRGGNYVVVVFDQDTECQYTATATVPDETVEVNINVEVTQHQTHCVGPGTGIIEVNIESPDGSSNIGINWYSGQEVDEAKALSMHRNALQAEDLSAGLYTIQAIDNNSGCVSNPVTVEVLEQTVSPVVSGTLAPNTACDAEQVNGSISLQISMPEGHSEPAEGYEVAWFAGSSTEGTPLEATGATVEGLVAGTYTAVVSHPESGCSTQQSFGVTENLNIPELRATAEPNTVCDPEQASGGAYTGAISLELSQDGTTVDDPADYLISWYRLEEGEESLLEKNAALNRTGLAPGSYRIIATHLSSGCQSAAFDIDVEERTKTPVTEISNSTNISNCQEPNGIVSATVAGGSENIVFRWYSGEEVNEASYLEADGNGATLEGLGAGSYTVVAINTQSGCVSAAETVSLSDDTSLPVVEIKDVQHSTNCDTPNGAATAYVRVGEDEVTEGYTFNWYRGTEAKEIPDYTGPTVSTLPEGIYSLEAVDNTSGCVSELQQLVIEAEDYPYEVRTELLRANTACEEEAYNGALQAWVVDADGTAVEGDFTFSWFPAAVAGEAEHLLRTAQTIEELGGGEYTVVMTDNVTACTSRATINLPNEAVQPVLSLQVNQHIAQCENADAGEIQASLAAEGDYSIHWYRGEGVSENSRIAGEAGLLLSGYPAGTYTAQAIDNVTLCVSNVETVVIEDLTANPEVDASLSSNRACDAAAANGNIILSISTPMPGADPEGGYQVAWYEGAGTDGRQLQASGNTIEGLAAGNYTAVVTNPETSCSSQHLFTIEDEMLIPVLNLASAEPNTVCDPSLASGGAYTGAIHLVLQEGDEAVEEPENYMIRWYRIEEGGEESLLAENTALTRKGLAAGRYRLEAISQLSGCSSEELVVAIEDAIEIPTVEAVNIQALTYCDTSNGAIEILPAGGRETGDYLIEWYQGAEAVATARLEEFSGRYLIAGLSAGAYTVQSTHTASGCRSAPFTLVIEDATSEPEVTVTSTPLTNCNPNRPDGAFSFNVNGETTGYSFVLYRGNEADEAALAGEGSEIEGLREGQYLLVTTSEATGCVSSDLIAIETGISFPETPVTIGAERCEAGELTLRVDGEGTYYWYNQPTGGNAFHAGDSFFRDFNRTTTFYVSSVNKDGCESRERSSVSAVIHELEKPVIEANDNVLSTAEDESLSYQWYLDGEPLDETGHTLTAEVSGSYEVEVTNEAGCSIRSSPYALTVSGLIDGQFDAAIKVYPNPFYNRLYISVAAEAGTGSIRLFDGQMRQLRSLSIKGGEETVILELSELPQGIYYMEIREGEKVTYRRVARQ